MFAVQAYSLDKLQDVNRLAFTYLVVKSQIGWAKFGLGQDYNKKRQLSVIHVGPD